MDSDTLEFHPLSRSLADAIPKVTGGPAWHGGSAKWARYLQQHEIGERWWIVATINRIPVGYGSMVRADDDLLIWMEKAIKQK